MRRLYSEQDIEELVIFDWPRRFYGFIGLRGMRVMVWAARGGLLVKLN